MTRSRTIGSRTAGLLLLACSAGALQAQQSRDPEISYAYPPGAKAGSSITMTVGGQNLEGMTEGFVSGDGVQARIIKFTKPLPQKRVNEFRDVIAEHKKQAAEAMQTMEAAQMEPADASKKNSKKPNAPKRNKEPDIAPILQEAGATDEEIRLFRIAQDQQRDRKRQENKQLTDEVTVQVDVAPDAAVGPRTLRLYGKNGLSNPVTVMVGNLPELSQPGATEPALKEPPTVTFPLVLNGQVLPGQTDSYRFHAVRGELLVFVAQARDLIPYLADAVPGWFEPVLTILNASGVPVADAQSFRFAPDPVLAFDVKETGDYTLQIRDAVYRGREDFVYRITAGKIPFVTGIFPLGGRLGSHVDLAVDGWNLPVRRMPVDVSAEGIQRLPRLANGFATMDVSFAGGSLPEMLAPGPGKTPTLPLPVAVNGRIEVPGQVAEFAVRGKKGEPLVAEVLARRLNSPLDSVTVQVD